MYGQPPNSDPLDHSCLFIIGNGFDLDLGYPTSYSDFVGNKDKSAICYYPFIKGGQDYYELGEYVRTANTIQKWYDLEDILARYGSKQEMHLNRFFLPGTEENDKHDFKKLVDSLFEYLSSLDYNKPKENSVAARILKAIPFDILSPTFYSFNYTDIELIGKALGVEIVTPTHIHGSLKSNKIILGAGDYANLRESSDFMYKTYQEDYQSSSIMDDLSQCDFLVIFGLSLSPVDYPYFKNFFETVALGDGINPYIRIITYDDSSRMEILRNLRKMNDGMIGLFNHSDFDIIRTKNDMDENKVQSLIKKIKTRCTFSMAM
jgi:hypothetical protein